jgi:molybdopterin/thiamine biosynthesis adenylyltransferase
MKLTEQQVQRYARHIVLSEVGGKGQQRLLESRVLCVGAGGLGSPALLYLAAAGVGTLGIVDSDDVELPNLQRQIIHSTPSLNMAKTESAKNAIHALNPDVNVRSYKMRLTRDNVLDVLSDYDAVLDGSDNFPTRYLMNDACFFARKPLFFGSVFRFEGQASVFMPGKNGPCYRCIFPEMPPADLVPSCQEAGILGVVPGIIALIQATECLKFLLGMGSLLLGRLLIYDALPMRFSIVTIHQNPKCPLCGNQPTIRELEDYDQETHETGR